MNTVIGFWHKSKCLGLAEMRKEGTKESGSLTLGIPLAKFILLQVFGSLIKEAYDYSDLIKMVMIGKEVRAKEINKHKFDRITHIRTILHITRALWENRKYYLNMNKIN
ncbi:Hypothetical predicted protein [Octopus vulgaris]|uniref:Uncharacterized protein n=1 Tax=Octopus vulgaris TaxID=6645 RepID=A0AA36F5N3_OCTVU|nr:Hypothetical predicted protein [Octopus vulgaris]